MIRRCRWSPTGINWKVGIIVVFTLCYSKSSSWVSTSLGNSGFCWSVFAWNRDTVVPAEGNGNLQTLICVLVARPRWCPTLSNPVPWQNWMVAYLGYTLSMKTLFRGWPVVVHDTHTRKRRMLVFVLDISLCFSFLIFKSHTLLYYCLQLAALQQAIQHMYGSGKTQRFIDIMNTFLWLFPVLS